MSEDRYPLFAASFNRAVKVKAVADDLSANAGTLLLREADHKLALTEDLAQLLYDPREPGKTRYPMGALLRERLYAFACGYAAQDDLDELAHDPAFRAAVWNRAGDAVAEERLASQPSQSRLVDRLVQGNNLEILRDFLAEVVIRHRQVAATGRRVKTGTLDIDSLPVTVYGKQEGGAFNGYYDRKVYLPCAAHFSPGGELDAERVGSGFVHACLRNGDAAPNVDAAQFILAAHARAQTLAEHLDVRADAAFAEGAVLDALTGKGIHFVMRLKENPVLKRIATGNVFRFTGRPPKEGYEWALEVGTYQAATWQYPQRLVLVVIDQPDATGHLKLFPDYFFLVTSWPPAQRDAYALLEHYRGRGTFEDRFGELNGALGPRLSSPLFVENEATLLLSLLAYNLAETLRREMESATASGWDLGRFQRTVLHLGARLVSGGHQLKFLLMRAFAPAWIALAGRLARWRTALVPAVPRNRRWVPAPAHAHLSYQPRL